MKVYLAGPVFTCAEREFNERLAEAIERQCKSVEIILPQESAAELSGAKDFAQQMFHIALDSIDKCDMVVAILDGPDADSGTCVEIGYAKAKGKPIIGVRTDSRASEDRGLNLMVANICSSLVLSPSLTVSMERLAKQIAENLTYKDRKEK